MCPSMHPGLTPGAPGQMSVQDILTIRRSLSLFGTSRQFAVIGPWEGSCKKEQGKASGFYRDVFRGYFKLAGLPHVCDMDFASTAQEASRLSSLASTGGIFLLDALCGQFSKAEGTGMCFTDLAKSSNFVDCIARSDSEVQGHNLKSQALLEHLSQGRKRTALVLSSGPLKEAILGGLQAAGFDEVRHCEVGSSIVLAYTSELFPMLQLGLVDLRLRACLISRSSARRCISFLQGCQILSIRGSSSIQETDPQQ